MRENFEIFCINQEFYNIFLSILFHRNFFVQKYKLFMGQSASTRNTEINSPCSIISL